MITKQEIIDLVKTCCNVAGHDDWVAYCLGIIEHESNFNPAAHSPPGASDDKYGGAFGLAQFLLPTAMSLGYEGAAEGLLDPAVNVNLLVRLTQSNSKRYGVTDAANLASCHNSGVPLTRLAAASKREHDVEAYVAAVLPLVIKWRKAL